MKSKEDFHACGFREMAMSMHVISPILRDWNW